jgi:(5-formylfuran-3-yl)methyl phosphate synthase
MTKMLASVMDEDELAMAMQADCDIIDLKNPHAGALGALPYETIRRVTLACGGQSPVSATVGDLPADPVLISQAVRATGECGVDYVKIGFFSEENLQACLDALSQYTSLYALVAVLFADRAPMITTIGAFAQAGFSGIMLDTAGKGAGGLLAHIDLPRLGQFVEEVHGANMFCGLAGSLRLEDISQLLPLGADYLGFRGALCTQGERRSAVVPQRLRAVRKAITSSDITHTQSIRQKACHS